MSDTTIINPVIRDESLSEKSEGPDKQQEQQQTTLPSSSHSLPLCTRRSHPRIYRKAYIRYSRHRSRHAHEAVMHNESGGGMYFETRDRLAPGTKIYITFDNGLYLDENGPLDFFAAEVKWCVPVNHSTGLRYGVGVQYSRPILH
ncbi:MAG: PilZ domain-containing protein [Desulfosudaceae bacterium]